MPGTIRQSVTLPAPARSLCAMYLNARAHAAITGRRVTISGRRGSKFTAFDGMLQGRTLYVVPGRLIVQAWRSRGWKADDLDSTLVLRFTPRGRRGRIDLVHVNVPGHDVRGVTRGWKRYYWRPWRRYLARR